MSHTTLSRFAIRLSSRSSLIASSRAIESPGHRVILLRAQSLHPLLPTARSFSISSTLRKKAGKANKSHGHTDSSPPINKTGKATATDEAFDLSGLEASILKAIEKLSHDLSQLRGGGKINPTIVENLKVQLGTAAEGKETVKLSEIAQVVPRGRTFHVICGEEAHIKPVSSAIASSPHSLTPLAPEASSPLTIQVPLPPPTGESRRAAIESAQTAADVADSSIQAARQAHHKTLRKFQVNREVLPDDLERAGKRMEEVVKKGRTEAKRIADGAKKVLESQG